MPPDRGRQQGGTVELDLETTLFAVCRLGPGEPIPGWAQQAPGPLASVTRTRDELSIVVAQSAVPREVQAETGWRALSVEGPLPFTLTGVLVSLAAPLADAGVPIFVLSTFDTDWLLVANDRLDDAVAALERAGHQVNRQPA